MAVEAIKIRALQVGCSGRAARCVPPSHEKLTCAPTQHQQAGSRAQCAVCAGCGGAVTCAPTQHQQAGSRAQCAADVSTVCTQRECDASISAVQIATRADDYCHHSNPAGPSRLGSRGVSREASAVRLGLRARASLVLGGRVADTQALASHRTREQVSSGRPCSVSCVRG